MKQAVWCSAVTAAMVIGGHNNNDKVGIKWAAQCPAETAKLGK
jgi:hypothetical protein